MLAMVIFSMRAGQKALLFMFPFFGILTFFMIKGVFANTSIKLAITNTDLLVRVPCSHGYLEGTLSGFYDFEFSIQRDIRDVSIKDARHSNLKTLLDDEQAMFRTGLTNTKLSWIHSRLYPSLLYQYIFVLPRDSLRGIQFIDLALRDGNNILIEFDDAQNFLSALKQRMAEIEAEAAQNEKELGEMMKQWRNNTWDNTRSNHWD